MPSATSSAPARDEAPAGDRPDRPVDLAHLARQTMGNRELEREVLHLFLRQSESCLARLADPAASREMTAHILVGSARGIGATRVAAIAATLEAAARRDPAAGEAEIALLAEAVTEANGFIRSLIALS